MAQGDVGIYASQISGHLWAPSGAMDALGTVTLSSGGVASVTFAGIPQGYRSLHIRGIAQSSRSGGGTGPLSVRFNGDTGSNYRGHVLYGEGTNATAYAPAIYTYAYCGFMNGNLTGADIMSPTIIDVLDYTSVSKNKTIRVLFGTDTNGSGQDVGLGSGLWMNATTAVNSITIYSDGNTLNQDTQFALYGVK